MNVIDFILLLLGAVCFAAAAFNVPKNATVNLVALGLLFWILVPLIAAGQHLH